MLIAMIIIMMKCRSVRWMCVVGRKKKVDIKHLVMTGKEHRLPQAVFSPPPSTFQARANHFLLF